MKHMRRSAPDHQGLKSVDPHEELWVDSLKMNAGRRAVCLLLCARVLMLCITAGDHVAVYRDTINVTIGHPVLLPVAFTLNPEFSKYTVEWEVGNRSILYHTVRNCTLDAQGYPTRITSDSFHVYPPFLSKVTFYKMNASLLINDAQVNDSGTYRISFSTSRRTTTQHIAVQVLMGQAPDSAAAGTWGPWVFACRTVLGFLPLAALLTIILVWG